MVRAIHEYCSDEGLTPYLLVDANVPGTEVPMHLVKDGTIVLNIAYSAVRELQMSNDWVLFSARFGGKAQNINVPMTAVRAIYAKENGQGCVFPEAAPDETADDQASVDAEAAPQPTVRSAPEQVADDADQMRSSKVTQLKKAGGKAKLAVAPKVEKGVDKKPSNGPKSKAKSEASTGKSKKRPSLKLVD